MAEVMDRVRRDYVEPIDDMELMDSAIRGMVSGLDRHSEFLDAEEYRNIRNSTSGKYSGVGLEVSTQDGAILVIAPIDDTPAQRAGIESGDEIIEIDGVSVRHRRTERCHWQNARPRWHRVNYQGAPAGL